MPRLTRHPTIQSASMIAPRRMARPIEIRPESNGTEQNRTSPNAET